MAEVLVAGAEPSDVLTKQPKDTDTRSLQQRFEAMKARRTAAARRVSAAEAATKTERPAAFKQELREKFVARVRSYIGTPYSAAKGAPAADGAFHLDCCGLVRRALLDLKEEFGFEVGEEAGDSRPVCDSSLDAI